MNNKRRQWWNTRRLSNTIFSTSKNSAVTKVAKRFNEEGVRLCNAVYPDGIYCNRHHLSSGYCNRHYRQIKKHKELRFDLEPKEYPKRFNNNGERICIVCDSLHQSAGYCLRHYHQMLRHGKILEDKPVKYESHGLSKHPLYKTWWNMLDRCLNKDSVIYENYGGRGITVCPRWTDIRNFLEDMGERPEGMTLDRIENDKGYSKENCRWATPSQQCINRGIPKNNKSGFKGVRYNGRSKNPWMAAISVNKKEIILGTFYTKSEAITARKEAELKYGYPQQ